MQNIEKLVPDTSVIIEGLVSNKIEKKEILPQQVMFHEAVLAELEHQANQGRAIGFLGLEEIKRVRQLAEKNNFKVKFSGKRPGAAEIKYASLGEIDALIRNLAWEEDATLLSSDKVQVKAAEARGVAYIYIKPEEFLKKKIRLDSFFDETTMSVHLRENMPPIAKKGIPGNWQFIELAKKNLTQDEIQDISKEIIETAKVRYDGFIEIQRESSTIVQLGTYRIVITKPPFSDGWEISAVRPVKRLSIEEYNLSEKLMQRITQHAEGILVAGAPGMGKTTMASAIANFYASQNKIVKTVESPRDLQLDDNITQYSLTYGDAQEIHDILLLSRPDHTIFDEMRNTGDFRLFADLRLAGIGFLGVIHATNPIDAIQRFVGRIELGVIPQIIDTVIFIKDGRVEKVLSLNMTVKVPYGMTEADLARPVVEVRDFETNMLEFELYSYGEETVVIPVKHGEEKNPARKLATKQVEDFMRKYTDRVKAEMVSDHEVKVYVPDNDKAKIIGRQGANISEIEKRLGLRITVKDIGDVPASGEQKCFDFEKAQDSRAIKFFIDESSATVDVYVNNQFLVTATASKKGEIRVKKKSKLGRALAKALNSNQDIELRLSEEA